MSDAIYKVREDDLVRFELIGEWLPDGTLRMSIFPDGKVLPGFPKKVEMLNMVFTLETVRPDPTDQNREIGVYH